jgi:hypothetical protein
MDIEDNHPLRDRVKWRHILPFCGICCPKKDDFKYCFRSALLDELELKKPKSDEMLNENPFLYLGYGVNAYFNVMLNLSKMFAMITLFCIPLYMVYSGNRQ